MAGAPRKPKTSASPLTTLSSCMGSEASEWKPSLECLLNVLKVAEAEYAEVSSVLAQKQAKLKVEIDKVNKLKAELAKLRASKSEPAPMEEDDAPVDVDGMGYSILNLTKLHSKRKKSQASTLLFQQA